MTRSSVTPAATTALCLALLLVPGAGAQTAASAPAATPGSVDLGDLEIIPSRSSMTLTTGRRGAACLEANLKFRVRNKSAGDLKLMLFRANLSAADANGKPIIDPRFLSSGGLALSDAPANAMRGAFAHEASKLATIAPKQVIEVQLNMQANRVCVADADGQMVRTYRPKTMSISGALGVVDVANAVDIKSFSLLDVPLLTETR